ncbi:MAG: sugar ABC transporter permease [Alphaproteobacteria bacterium]|nr:sugar ABC transporter permease [Alphaproteobacteria bacterium]
MRSKFNWEAWVFILPTCLLLLAFLVWPTMQTIYYSFFKGNFLDPTVEFFGLGHYDRLLTGDRQFLRINKWPPSGALINTIVWIIFLPTLTVIFGLVIAVLADGKKYETFIKSIIFVPMAISATAASVIFRFVYNNDPETGALNALLVFLLPEFEPVSWLGRKTMANFAVIFAAVWIWTGLAMTILSAAYKALPQEIIEAAIIDGATQWQRFWRLVLPMLSIPITFLVVVMIINALKMIDLVYVMTMGGPRGGTRVIGFSIYVEMFANGKIGYGSAIGAILLILVLPIILYQLRQTKKQL